MHGKFPKCSSAALNAIGNNSCPACVSDNELFPLADGRHVWTYADGVIVWGSGRCPWRPWRGSTAALTARYCFNISSHPPGLLSHSNHTLQHTCCPTCQWLDLYSSFFVLFKIEDISMYVRWVFFVRLPSSLWAEDLTTRGNPVTCDRGDGCMDTSCNCPHHHGNIFIHWNHLFCSKVIISVTMGGSLSSNMYTKTFTRHWSERNESRRGFV